MTTGEMPFKGEDTLTILSSLANVTPDTSFIDRLYYAFLPMVTLVLVIVAHMMRMTRASVLSVMASPYIEMAILKGGLEPHGLTVWPQPGRYSLGHTGNLR